MGAWDGRVRRFRGQSLEWSAETGAEVTAACLVVGERVYVGSRDGTLYAYEKDRPLFRFRAGGTSPQAPPSTGAWSSWEARTAGSTP